MEVLGITFEVSNWEVSFLIECLGLPQKIKTLFSSYKFMAVYELKKGKYIASHMWKG